MSMGGLEGPLRGYPCLEVLGGAWGAKGVFPGRECGVVPGLGGSWRGPEVFPGVPRGSLTVEVAGVLLRLQMRHKLSFLPQQPRPVECREEAMSLHLLCPPCGDGDGVSGGSSPGGRAGVGVGLTSPKAAQGVGLQEAGDEVLGVRGQCLIPFRPQDLI